MIIYVQHMIFELNTYMCSHIRAFFIESGARIWFFSNHICALIYVRHIWLYLFTYMVYHICVNTYEHTYMITHIWKPYKLSFTLIYVQLHMWPICGLSYMCDHICAYIYLTNIWVTSRWYRNSYMCSHICVHTCWINATVLVYVQPYMCSHIWVSICSIDIILLVYVQSYMYNHICVIIYVYTYVE